MSIKPNTDEEKAKLVQLPEGTWLTVTSFSKQQNTDIRVTDGDWLFRTHRYDPVVEPEPLECWMVEEDNGYKWSTLSAGTKTRAERLGHKVSHMTPATLDADVLREHAISFASICVHESSIVTFKIVYDRWIKEQEGNGDE